MQKSEAVAWFGSQHKLAAFLGVAQSNVSAWKTVPKKHQRKIEAHTKGELIAEEEDTIPKVRYMCFIEKSYVDMLNYHAQSLGIPVVDVLRRAIAMYDKKNRAKD
jgi:DNA-binding transcriptional regulator YdaS (Cro superfamily)